MLVYIYAADIYCEQCGEAIRERITREGFAASSMCVKRFEKAGRWPECGPTSTATTT